MLIEKCNITFSKFSQKAGGQNGGQCPVVVKPEIQDTSQALTSSMNVAKQTSIAAIRHAKTISDSSDKSEDQEAIEKMEMH